MIKKFLLSVNDYQPGDHLCHIYDREGDRLAVTEAFFRQGIERKAKALFLTGASRKNPALNKLLGKTPGVEAHRAAAEIRVIQTQAEGKFSEDPQVLFDLLGSGTGGPSDGSLTGSRILIDSDWMQEDLSCPQDFIALLNHLDGGAPALPYLTICQLDRSRFDPALLMDLVMVHPFIIIGTETFNNFYYIPPASLTGQDLSQARLNEWINNLVDFRHSAEELFFTRFWVESASDSIFWIKVDGSFQYANKAACQELGYTLDELLNMKVGDIDPIFSSEEWHSLWKDLKKKGQIFFETRHRTKTGQALPVEIKANYLKYEGREYVCAIARDISERRLAEAALKENQDKTNALLNAIPDLMFIYSSDGVFLDYYAADPSTLFLPPGQFLGRAIGDIFPPEFTKPFLKLSKKALATGKMQFYDYPIELKGEEHFYEARIAPFGSDNLLMISRQITDRKLAENRLRESRERYRMVAEFTYDWEYWLDENGKFIYISPSCERITGYSYQAYLKDPGLLVRIVHPQDRQRVMEHDREMSPERTVCQLDYRIISRQGEEHWISHFCQPVFGDDGRYMGRRGSNRDITDRKKTEDALARSEEAFRLLVEGVTDYAFFTLDLKGKITSWNAGAERISGYSMEEALGQDLGIFYPALERARSRPKFELSMASKKGHYEQEGWRLRKDGSKFYANVVTTALYDKEGVVTSFARITRDITARKLEQEMQKYTKPSALSDY